ncbi:hypothetical protein LPJ73_000006 [Coemansia sp. RSA 2703]|nr:hypothetical protein LPJ73_000006 [Coemansia sp. RSA 2703]KAJ2379384.1 hypothetical protein IW150_000204 [Coemansia sp. RSA 2607]KAJ2398394.1 hypothetical protein GGI05_000111 [Coemansia sp. RSA 2603]
MPISPPVVTFSNIDDDEEPSLVANGLVPPDRWQAGRTERIRRLEAALDVTTRLRLRQQRRAQLQPQTQQEHDYGDMLDSENEDNRGNDNGRNRLNSDDSSGGSDDGNTCSSETSSLFYSEGQPLLCTYYQPPDAPTVTTPGTVFSGYGSIGNASSAMPPPKTAEQFLPWRVRIWNKLLQTTFVCGCGGRQSKDARPED